MFDDLIGAFNGALQDMGRYNEKTGRPIAFGAHVGHDGFHPYGDPQTVVYNTEVLGSPWMTRAYLEMLRVREVWDYAEENVEWLATQGIKAKWCPIRYHKSLTRLELKPDAEREIDVLFYGSMTKRRKEIYLSLQPANAVFSTHEDWSMRDSLLANSRIVLNLHAYDQSPLEMARISYLLANKCFILSEGPVWKGMEDCIMFTDPEWFPIACRNWLADDEGRRVVAERGFQKFSAMSQAAEIERCIYAQ